MGEAQAVAKAALMESGWREIETGVYTTSNKELLADNRPSTGSGIDWDAEYEAWRGEKLRERERERNRER